MFIPFFIDTERDWNYRQRVPWVVCCLISTYVLFHLYLTQHISPEARTDLFYRYGVVSSGFQWYTVFTCTFLHSDWLHLLGNCYFLWLFGTGMEKLFGSVRFLFLFTAGALLSMMIHLWAIQPFVADMPTIGASGAISAVLGGFFVILPKAKVRCLVYVIYRPRFVSVPSCIVLGAWFLWQLFCSIEPALAEYGVAFWAHTGGFAAGTAYATLLYGLILRQASWTQSRAKGQLAYAWDAYLDGNFQEAARAFDMFDDSTPESLAATKQPFLAALLCLNHNRNPQEAATMLFAALHLAASRLEHARALTIYLQIRERIPKKIVPAKVHRDGAYSALSCSQPAIGLQAMADAFKAGLDEGTDILLGRAEAVLRNTLGLTESADEVSGLIKKLEKSQNEKTVSPSV